MRTPTSLRRIWQRGDPTPSSASAPRLGSRLKFILATLLIIGASAGGAHTTAATFASSTRNPNNQLSTGTVVINDNDSGSALTSATGLQANATVTSCIRVTYTGSLPSTVRLYGTTSGALAPYVTMTITRGSGMGTFPSCSGFTPDSATYVGGQGQGVIWTGTLDSFPSTYGTGVIDPPTGAATWTTNTERVYRIQFQVGSDNNAGNKSSSTTLTWQAQNI